MRYILLITLLFILSCGGSSSLSNNAAYIDIPKNAPCNGNNFYRLKTKECLPLKNPSWGFKGFDIPNENIYTMQACTEEELERLIREIPDAGGKIIMPECTINTDEGIVLHDNIILEGAGIGKTIINNHRDSAVSLHGKNIIVRNFSVEGNNDTLNGINGYRTKGNVLVEFIEVKNVKTDQGAGISFLTENKLDNSRVTIRYCSSSNALLGIDIKVHTSAKMLIYSNQSFNNTNHGLDLSTNSDIEVAGNYLHDNYVAGAKSPKADNIIYHNNDINYNGKQEAKQDNAGLVYTGSNPNATITVEDNDLSNNGGKAFECWDANFHRLILKNNIVSGSLDANGYSIGIIGVDIVDVYGYHGKIWDEKNGNVIYH